MEPKTFRESPAKDPIGGLHSRRALLQAGALLPMLMATAPSGAAQSNTQEGTPPAGTLAAGAAFLAGIQMSPVSVLDEGIDACLDFLQQHAAINAIFCYTQTYHQSLSPLDVLATDHPSPPRDPAGRKLPWLWVRLPDRPFRGLPVQHERPDPRREYGNRDVFRELLEACGRRGIRVYARILEAGMNRAARIPGYETVATIDLDGQPGQGPCWNHPAYRDWVRITAEQTMREYPFDGLQYGAERVGPLSEVLFRGDKPACFCAHCRQRNARKGINPERALAGYRELYTLIHALEQGGTPPADGVFATVIRVLFQYPEVLAWYREWFQADEEMQTLVYRAAKRERPSADVGQHVDHQRSSWDIFYRAAVRYEDMAAHNDFVKPILYHDILGPRLRWWVIDRIQQRVLRDFSQSQALAMFYSLFGHDGEKEPELEALADSGLSPAYVWRETKRCVEGVKGKTRVYAGIGFDVPWHLPEGGMRRFASRPELVYQATRRAIEAGAHGVVASREYDENTLPNLQAFGRAVREG